MRPITILCLLLGLLLPVVADAGELPAELRERVEALKQAVAESPAVGSTSALDERAQTLYAWANARALDGDDIPWSLPQLVAQVARLDHLPRGETATRQQLAGANAAVSDYVRQLQLRDENPSALGTVTVVNPGPHPVRTWQTIEVRYEIGSEGLEEDGIIAIGAHGRGGIVLQASDPQGKDYVTAKASREGVDIVPAAPTSGGRIRSMKFAVEGGDLQAGDTVTFLYGDTSEGGPGVLMQPVSNDFIPMELHVGFEPDGTEYVLPRFALETEGGPIKGVRGFAPSVVATGEVFTFSVRAEDEYTNRATGPIPGWRLELDGKRYRNLPAGNAITLVDDVSFDEPGVYRFTIRSRNGDIVGEVNPILVEDQPRERIYWGETHGHSGMAEGQGTSDAFFSFGRDDARLDFLVHSEHDIWMDDAEWQELAANTKEFLEEGEFITFLGYEWTVEQAYGGHHNVLFRTPDNRERVPQQTHPALSMLYQGLRERHDANDVVIIPHAHQAGDWRRSDPTMETLVEIQSNHGNFEWFGHMYLRHGHHVGFVSASDDHTSHPGYGVARGRRYGLAGVAATEKTTDAIFDAMKSLRTYAVSGDRAILRFGVNDASMGERAPFDESRRVHGTIHGTAPIDEIVVLRNSEEIWRRDLRTDSRGSGKRQYFEVNVASASRPLMDQRDNPRGSRSWGGTIDVEGAKLVDVRAPGYVDVLTQGFEIDESNPARVNFRTWTRGNHSSLILVLEEVSENARISVDLEPARETQNGFTRYRGVVQLPSWQADFSLDDMTDGVLVQEQAVAGYDDSISLRRVVDGAPLDYEFEFEDTSPRQGDYYTLRVIQANDQMIWSSPVWVGGYSAR